MVGEISIDELEFYFFICWLISPRNLAGKVDGGDESCGWDINNCNIVVLILERLRDPKNVIVSQGNNHFLWNWDCADFCWCCGHWFISLNGTTSVKRTLASVTMLNCHSGLFLSIFSIPGMVSPGKMEVSLTTDMKRCVDSVLLPWDHGRSAKWQRNQTHLQHGASWVLVGEPV